MELRREFQGMECILLISKKPRRMRFGSLRRFCDSRSFLWTSEGKVDRICGNVEKEKVEMIRNLCPLVVSMS